MKRWVKILVIVLAALIAIPIAIAVTLRIPAVQDKICKKVVSIANESIDGELEIGSIHFIPFNTLSLSDVNLLGNDSDTLTTIGQIYLNINEFSLLTKNFQVNRVKIENTDLGELAHLLKLFKKEKKDTTVTNLPWSGLRVNSLIIDSLSFDYDTTYKFKNICLTLNDFFLGDGIYGTLSSLSLREESGLDVKNLCTYFLADRHNAILKGFKYKDDWSNISIPIIQLQYGSPRNFSNLSDSILVQAVFEKSSFGLGSAGTFVNKLRGNSFNIFIDGSIKGKLSNFATRNLTVRTSSGGTNLQVSAIVKGLPVPQETQVNFRVNQSYTSAQDIITIIKAFSDTTKIRWLDNVDPKEKLNVNCSVHGTFSEMTAKVHLESNELGLLDANISSKNKGVRIVGGEFSTENIDIGKIIGSKKIGKVSLYAAGWAGVRKDSLRAEIMSAEIDRLDFNGYKYCDISGACSINKNHYRADLSSLDTNLFFKMMADYSVDDNSTSHFTGSGNFNRIDLTKLNLVKLDTCLTSFLINFDFSSTPDKNVLGDVDIKDLMAVINKDFFDIGPVSIKSSEKDEFYTINIESSLLSATYQGSDYLYGLVSDAVTQVTSQLNHLVPVQKSNRKMIAGSYGVFNLVTGDLKPVAALLPKNIYINSGTCLNFKMENHKNLDILLTSELLAVNDKFVKDLNLHLNSEGGPIFVDFTTEMLQSGETAIERDTLSAVIENNTIEASLSYNDRDQRFGQGKVNTILTFPDTLTSQEKIIAGILPSHIIINEKSLDIDSSNVTVYRNKRIKFDNLKITNGESYLHLDGAVSQSRQDTISLDLKDFDFSGLNFLFKKKINLEGIFSGKCTAIGLGGKELSFLADFEGKNIGADGEKLGDLKILSKLDEKNQRINFLVSNIMGENKPLNIVGSWSPFGKELTAKVKIDKLNIGWLDPFLVGVMDHTVGTASGELSVDSRNGETKMTSNGLCLNDVHTNLSYTKVPYILDGPFEMDEKGIYLKNISIKDTKGKAGTINGEYWLQGENKGKIDLLFDLKSIHGLNTTFQDAGQGFWGNANATGKVRVYGPMRGLRFDIDIETEEGEIHIPLDETTKVSKRDILTFVNRHNAAQSAYDSILNVQNIGKNVKKRKGGVKCDIKLKASPMTTLVVDINRTSGDRAAVKGIGNVEMRTGEGQFDIRGSYQVQEGNCHFTILGITAKDFAIREGGTINFVGPILESDFKLSAAYQTKASLETLFGDTKSVSTRRTVNCVINLTGKIDNPKISFKIDVPDLDPSYKNMLDSALSTEEKNLRQGLALLVSGGFIPDQQSGIVNNTTFLYSNASEIVSNQISNIFHQLDIPIDLGLKYQPGSSGVDLFDVAISTQLFNNRVTINGSIGNKEYATSGSTSNIIGNIDVGIKLNKTGQLKLNVFSHAADQYSNYLDQSQRNGAGVTYQEEFATFKELWYKIFKPKQKQAAR